MPVRIPFVKEMEFAYGVAAPVSPLIRRLVAENPGPFTYLGTGVYLVGAQDVAVIDPGPDQPSHVENLLAALDGRRLAAILITHTHRDHSPAAAPLAQATGAKIYASALAAAPLDLKAPGVQLEAGDDLAFGPDVLLADGDRVSGPGWTLQALATPGHTGHHMAFALLEENCCFTGDHIMGWSTSVVVPPDGDMADYMASLEKVRAGRFDTLWPTHGPPVRDVAPFLDAYIAHRQERETQILRQLREGRHTIPEIVSRLYAAVDPRLHPAARQSVLAHMIQLVDEDRVAADGPPSLAARYTLRSAAG
jgi:glyoxylase-like metal-dependent hydrolase (beta-lactamase superfamily II)